MCPKEGDVKLFHPENVTSGDTTNHGTWIANNVHEMNVIDPTDNATLHTKDTHSSEPVTDCETDSVSTHVVNNFDVPIDDNSEMVKQAIDVLELYYETCKKKKDILANEKFEKRKTVQKLFNIVKGNRDLATYMHVSADVLRVDGFKIHTNNVLLDTGALHGSYVSKRFVDKHRHELHNDISTATGSVKFGNKDNLHKISEVLIVPIAITCRHSKRTYQLRTVFSVVDLTNDFIIGLPDLADSLAPLFVKAFILRLVVCNRTKIEKF